MKTNPQNEINIKNVVLTAEERHLAISVVFFDMMTNRIISLGNNK